MDTPLPTSWSCLQNEVEQSYFHDLMHFVAEERKTQTVLPADENVFAALDATPYDKVKVLILGQDPYHDIGQAHGLCFSVMPDVKKLPPSLRNIYKELDSDLGIAPVEHGYLMSWAEQGVLLLNTVLTVRAHEANSHRKQGWETFTDSVIRAVSEKSSPVVFVLWGKPAQKKKSLVDTTRHCVIESPHPSPLSAYRGFFGSKPFSRVNDALTKTDQTSIQWQLPTEVDLRRLS